MTNVDYMKHITRHDLSHHRDTIFVFGDNDMRTGMGGQAREMRGEPNAIGVRVKKSPSTSPDAYYTDDEYPENIRKITEDLRRLKVASHNKNIIFPEDGIGTGLALLYSTAPKTFEFLTLMLQQNFGITNGNMTIQNKIRETLYKEPMNRFKPKFNPGDLKRGDGIVFSKMGTLLKGDIVDIQNEGNPNEIFKVAIHDESTSVIKTRHLNTTSTGAVIDILYKGTPREECVVRLLDGSIKNIRTNWIKYRKHQGPIKIGDEVGFDNKNITVMIVLPSDVKSKIIQVPSEYQESHGSSDKDIFVLRGKKNTSSKIKSKLMKVKSKAICKSIRKPIKKVIKKSPIKKCKCKK